MELGHEKTVQKQLSLLLWEAAEERDDSAWAGEWRTLLAEECFTLSGIGALQFSMLWPVRDLGYREELLWQELSSLERLRRIAPDCAEHILTEMTGTYLLVRGLEYFGIELYRKRRQKSGEGQEGILGVNESPEEAAYLNYQEMRLADSLRQLGITFTKEDYLWQFLRYNHPSLDDALYFWREFGKLWNLLSGRELRANLSDDFVGRYLTAMLEHEYRTEDYEQQTMYALQKIGTFRNNDQKSTYLHKAMQRIFQGNKQVFQTLLRKGFFSRRELREKAKDNDTPDWMMPVLIMAIYQEKAYDTPNVQRTLSSRS